MSKSQYELIDPSGRIFKVATFEALVSDIREGKIFPSTRIKGGRGGNAMVGGLPGVQDVVERLISPSGTPKGSAHKALSGNLGPLSIAHCLVHVARHHLSGRLYAVDSHTQQTTVVIFREGACSMALSDNAQSFLGHMLVQMGLVQGEALEAIIDRRGQENVPLGQALIGAGLVDEAQINAALTLQSATRLSRLFSSRSGVFQFSEASIPESEPVRMSLSLRDLLFTGLGVGLDDRQLTGALAPYEQNPMEACLDPFTTSQLESQDQQFLTYFENGASIRNALPTLEQRFGSSAREVRLRLLTLIYLGALVEHGKQTREIEQMVRKARRMSYDDLLGVQEGATPEQAEAAYAEKLDEYGAHAVEGVEPELARLRADLAKLLSRAYQVLSDPAQSSVYFDSKRTGVDFEDEGVKNQLLMEYYVRKGHSSLSKQAYGEAEAAFAAAIEHGATDSELRIQTAWAGFLNSPQKAADADHAIDRINTALGAERDEVDVLLVKGKILRLGGQAERAKELLNRVVALDSTNNEAYAQLRLLNTRKSSNSAVPSISFEVSEGLSTILGISVLAIAICYFCTNFMPGEYTQWPDIQTANVTRAGTGNMDKNLVEKIQARLNPERDLTIPVSERVMGNVEFYYLDDDPWFWGRRGLLIVLAILGIAAVNRKERDPLAILGSNGQWIFIAMLYGLIAGLFSPTMQTPTAMGPLLGMTAFHVLAEQLFFVVFLGRSLLKRFSEPLLAVCLVAAIYGAYQLTFYATLAAPPGVLLRTVPQVAVFAGGAYTFFLWKSGGILTPFIAHLIINGSVAIRSIQGLA